MVILFSLIYIITLDVGATGASVMKSIVFCNGLLRPTLGLGVFASSSHVAASAGLDGRRRQAMGYVMES
jgi:hypothetical protein